MPDQPGSLIEQENQELSKFNHCNDEDLFNQIYASHRKRLQGIALFLFRQKEDADDAVQTYFAKLHMKKRKSYDPSKGNARAYLARCFFRLCCAILKKRGRTVEVSIDDENETIKLGETLSKGERQNSQIEAREIMDLVWALPPEFRSVIQFRLIDEVSTKETGEALRIPAGTVKSRLSHGLSLLRKKVFGKGSSP